MGTLSAVPFGGMVDDLEQGEQFAVALELVFVGWTNSRLGGVPPRSTREMWLASQPNSFAVFLTLQVVVSRSLRIAQASTVVG